MSWVRLENEDFLLNIPRYFVISEYGITDRLVLIPIEAPLKDEFLTNYSNEHYPNTYTALLSVLIMTQVMSVVITSTTHPS
jgi:hypothetical protein